MKTSTFFGRIRAFFTKKRIIWTVVILIILFLGWLIFGPKKGGGNIQTEVTKVQNIKKTVLTTGQVVSETDLDLSFQTNGVVRRINVKEGDPVKKGQILAVLDQGNALAQLESAQGALAQAKANYDKMNSPATPADVAVSQSAVDAATVSLNNAKQNLKNELQSSFNDVNTAILVYTNPVFANPQTQNPQFSISGTIQTNTQLLNSVNTERLNINSNLSVWQTENGTLDENNVDKVVSDALNNIQAVSNYFSDVVSLLTNYTQLTSGGSQTTLASYQTGASTGKSAVSAAHDELLAKYQSVRSAEASLIQAQASLDLKKSPARSEDLAIANAQVLSAQGQVDLAQANLNNTIIIAPIDGTVTQIDVKLGEQATALKEAMKLLDVGALHAEADVSEADIASVQVGQTIDNTFDALGPDQHFTGKVLTVNPASTVVSGVVDYKVTGSLDNIPNIKPGMTVNMTILIAEKDNVLTVPSSAIINKNGQKTVRVILDPNKKTYHEVSVQTGLEGDGGETEVLSGLSSGQSVVTYIK